MVICMLTGVTACGGGSLPAAEEPAGAGENIRIGVSVYDTRDAEVKGFRRYFEEYLGPAFDVSFIYSDGLDNAEEEIAFIEKLHEEKASGIISFLSSDIDAVLKKCDELGMPYLRGSGTISDEDYKKACGHESFLGIIGPDWELERKAGYMMTSSLIDRLPEETPKILILAGGGSIGNVMHEERTMGMLNALKVRYGLKYKAEISELDHTDAPVEDAVENGLAKVSILPGYLRDGKVIKSLEELFAGEDYDVVLGALALNSAMPTIEAEESSSGKDILVGMVDAFTEQNFDWFSKTDIHGNTTINYVAGKYCATVGPAFAAMLNAAAGDADFLKPEGHGFRLKQDFWTADNFEDFERLYEKSVNIYDNIYSAQDLRSVIRIYTPKATYEEFRALTERDNQ